MNANAELRLARVDKRSPAAATDISRDEERSWFQFDREVVLRHLDDLNGAIDSNADELKMVAAEGVFDQALSADLIRASRALRTIANSVSDLRKQVTRAAKYPGGSRKQK